MGKPEPTHDPLRQELEAAWANYQLLAARVPPGQGQGGRRPQPASRPPLQVQIVSHMHEFERLLTWFNNQARYLLSPVEKVELTTRLAVRCPYCGGNLVAWVWKENPDRSEIVCGGLDHQWEDGPNRWPPSEWKRLGVLLGTHEDGRFTVQREGQRPA